MISTESHHDQLIAIARQNGWIPGFGWRTGLRRAVKHSALWESELPMLEESIADEQPRPDAWRISVEDRLCVLEFLEVEVTSGVTQTKDDRYRFLWDMFDATSYFHLRIWHMDRFGAIRPYITDSTHHPAVFGMNAGRRS